MPHIKLLGHLHVHAAGNDVTPTAPRERHILVLLALSRTISVHDITSALWPAPPVSARNSIHVAINRLRARLGSNSITTHGRTYTLASQVTTDYDRFVELESSDSPDDWQALIDITSRSPLDDLRYDKHILAFATRVIQVRIRAAVRLASYLATYATPQQALDLIERMLTDHPDSPELTGAAQKLRPQPIRH